MHAPGTILLGKYRIERQLGTGGMGVVVKAHHLQLDQPVAIKFLRADKIQKTKQVKRFLREAQAAVKLQSEHVCSVYDVGTLESGSPYMVMEYINGLELRELAMRKELGYPQVVDLVMQACSALAEAHSLGIVHRDIKPANLFVTQRPDGTPLLKVLDFGISKAPVTLESELTNTQTTLGTPAYMSPEQMRSSKRVDSRTDIWALGVVLYELLAGHRPFRGQSFSELCLQVGMDPTPPIVRNVPAGLRQAAYRCLEKEPDKRFQNMAELAAALAPHASARAAATGIAESVSRTLGVDSLVESGAELPLVRVVDTASGPVAGAAPSLLSSDSTLGAEGAGEVRRPASSARRIRLVAGLAFLALAATMIAVFMLRGTRSSDSGNSTGAASAPAAQPAADSPEAAPADDIEAGARAAGTTAARELSRELDETLDAAESGDESDGADEQAAGSGAGAKARSAAAKVKSRKSRTRRKSRRDRRNKKKQKDGDGGGDTEDDIFGTRN